MWPTLSMAAKAPIRTASTANPAATNQRAPCGELRKVRAMRGALPAQTFGGAASLPQFGNFLELHTTHFRRGDFAVPEYEDTAEDESQIYDAPEVVFLLFCSFAGATV